MFELLLSSTFGGKQIVVTVENDTRPVTYLELQNIRAGRDLRGRLAQTEEPGVQSMGLQSQT